MKKLKIIAVTLVVLYVIALAGLLAVMRDPIRFGKVVAKLPEPLMYAVPFKPLWFIARAGRLKVGDATPDFTLPTADEKSRPTVNAPVAQAR